MIGGIKKKNTQIAEEEEEEMQESKLKLEGGELLVYALGICLDSLHLYTLLSPSDPEHILMSHWHTALIWNYL